MAGPSNRGRARDELAECFLIHRVDLLPLSSRLSLKETSSGRYEEAELAVLEDVGVDCLHLELRRLRAKFVPMRFLERPRSFCVASLPDVGFSSKGARPADSVNCSAQPQKGPCSKRTKCSNLAYLVCSFRILLVDLLAVFAPSSAVPITLY